ncbi:DUF2156 domain-containing protein [Pelorhabdus rhamnosifermentans]|uniref:DUF2156 domain-containing protein n=1 Tax=Pelorhabdus rhamnosifermentans TaxID=2772457 RepID=UPI001C060F79|nr:phosphatidylglycerol lysyltransferase domain-containing protein [Pelorhabdus rhamnosifermentans]
MVFILFQPVLLEDKEVIDEFLHSNPSESSNCNFTNFYMWRKPYHIEWTVVDDCLCVKASHHGQTYLLPPVANKGGNIDKALVAILRYFEEMGEQFMLKGVTVESKAVLEALRPGNFQFVSDRDNFDYVYLAEDLIGLKGRKYSSKKNHLNYFKRTYSQYQYLSITNDLLPSCLETALEWYDLRGLDEESEIELEKAAVIDLLNHYEVLGLSGGAILIDGKMEAFTIGEQLTSNMALVHIEKGNPNIRGVYQAINQEFCRDRWSDMKYINREEDMGMEGLRQAKESYHPVKLVEKYDAFMALKE